MTSYLPKRGDIVWIDFDPVVGHEQGKKRPSLVLSPDVFNDKVKLALIVPITSKVKGFPFEVKIDTKLTQGVALCHQMRTMDYVNRGCDFIEKVPLSVLNDVIAKVRVIVN